ncbi:hypothetical protein PYCCODRAFT_1478855 [Trametes coccinea BRFM310]|uniref:UBC core domain-containing protein n=1 Tax=Trametes coccinea (strain BRFM310) TaxID=1353009 RepID=A0A1Y2II57_TRAC3|nr:hypothetical protein PYCCODRAFT_1478855 [Trametes coccinea BRFM310]
MRGQKRRLSVEPENAPKTKRPALASGPNADDGEDSLESILALIQAQEESEALARKLQQEWNPPGPSNSSAPKDSGASRRAATPDSVIEISDDEHQEDDETIARRLAKQWELEDTVPGTVPAPPTNLPSTKGKATSLLNTQSTTRGELPTSALEQFRYLFTRNKTCSCDAEIPSPRGYVVLSSQKLPVDVLRLLHVPCKSCNTNHCRGCMSSTACPSSCKGNGQAMDCPVKTCCAEVRAIALFEVLGAFDRQYLEERATSDERARETAAKARYTHTGSVGPGGTGYGCDNRGWGDNRRRGRGRGRGRAGEDDIPPQDSASHSRFDEVIACAIKTVTDYLPSPYRDDAQMYDMLPHPSIGSLLLASQLPDLLGTLLRNDSVTDWIARSDVYHAMLALLRRMADCELTLEVLVGARWETTKSCGLEEWMWDDGEIVWEKDTETGRLVPAPPLYVHFKKLTKQCETFLAGASHMLESAAAGEDAETLVKATSLCGDIIAAKDDIERAMTIMGKDPATILEMAHQSSAMTQVKGKARDPAIDMERTYASECERLAFKHVSLSRPSTKGMGLDYPDYHYAQDLSRTANATRNPKDRLHLVKELAVMATSLPPGVWVRVDEVRNDALKIMIAGPDGTPYAGGLFEFDCFIPLEYPNKPPLMHLRTTGGGTVRFNPNLYSNGKVCLSLLGTWEGRPEEMWQPRKSTLLQVLVSIQSMILIEHPWFNEPGRGHTNPNLPASVAYNQELAKETIRWAIVDWLNDKHRDGLWGDVIASHFLTRNEVIRKCILDWAARAPVIRRYRAGPEHKPHVPMGVLDVANHPPYPSAENFQPSLAGTGGYYGGASAGVAWQNPIPSAHRAGPAPANGRREIDLLDEFDKGIERVAAWKLSG